MVRMIDMDKVLLGLKCCAVEEIGPTGLRHCGFCPYERDNITDMDWGCMNDLLCDAFKLLRGQEGLKAEWVYDRPHHWKCSECGTMYGESHIFFKYCPECGAKIRKG